MLDKKYALPYRVLDALVGHFVCFEEEPRALPVVWHQALLTFVQRYKKELTREDKDKLRRLCGVQKHYLMTPEVLRELQSGVSRGEAEAQAPPGAGGRATGGASAVGGMVQGRPGEDWRSMAPVLMSE